MTQPSFNHSIYLSTGEMRLLSAAVSPQIASYRSPNAILLNL